LYALYAEKFGEEPRAVSQEARREVVEVVPANGPLTLVAAGALVGFGVAALVLLRRGLS
jgi:hypothetical protein